MAIIKSDSVRKRHIGMYLDYKFGIGNLYEIGEAYGVSHQRVHQIVKKFDNQYCGANCPPVTLAARIREDRYSTAQPDTPEHFFYYEQIVRG